MYTIVAPSSRERTVMTAGSGRKRGKLRTSKRLTCRATPTAANDHEMLPHTGIAAPFQAKRTSTKGARRYSRGAVKRRSCTEKETGSSWKTKPRGPRPTWRREKMPGDYYIYQGPGNVFVHSEASADKAIEWAKAEHLSWKQTWNKDMRYRVCYNGFKSTELFNTDNPEVQSDSSS